MTRTYKLSLAGGIAAGYAVLAGLLFYVHSDPASIAGEVTPLLAAVAVALAVLLFAPNRETEAATGWSNRFLSWAGGCGQKASWLQLAALAASGFFFGMLLHKLVRLIA